MPYTTLQPTRTVMRTHLFTAPLNDLLMLHFNDEALEIPGIELWLMAEPSGQVWTWDGWLWE